MSSVDNRVVQMTFDNAKFENGIKQTLASLTHLDKTIQTMDKASDYDNLQGAIDSVNKKFSLLGTVADQVVRRITDQITNLAQTMVSSFTVKPIVEGFNTYEQKINATQQIMNAASVSEKDALGYLNDLNEYSDKTIYRFTDMTSSLGKFTAAGVDLNKATTAIKGLGNVAAISGASTNDFSRAIYNVSQALGQGKVQLMDWRSIENANMATKEFKQQLIDAGVAAGTLRVGTDGVAKSMAGNEVTWENLRNTLQDGWLTSDVLIDTLQKYADTSGEVGAKAFEAATRVKTFHQLLETLGDSVATAWSRVFGAFIGEYEDAAVVWTAISDGLSTVFQKPVDVLADGLIDWRDNMNGRTKLLNGLSAAFQGLGKMIAPIGDAWKKVFPNHIAENMLKFSEAVEAAGTKLKLFWDISGKGRAIHSDAVKALDDIRNTASGLFSVMKIKDQVFKDGIYILSPLLNVVTALSKAILGITGPIGKAVTKFGEWYTSSDNARSAVERLHDIVAQFATYITSGTATVSNFVSALIAFGSAAVENIGSIISLNKVLDIFSSILAPVKVVVEGVGDALNNMFNNMSNGISESAKSVSFFGFLGNTLDGFVKTMLKVSSVVSGVFSGIGSGLSKIFEDFSIQDFFELFTSGSIAVGAAKLPAVIDSITSIPNQLNGLAKSVSGVFDSLGDTLKTFTNKIKADILFKVALSITAIAISLKLLSTIEIDDMVVGLSGLAGAVVSLVIAFKLIMRVADGMGGGGLMGFLTGKASPTSVMMSLIGLATAVVIMAEAIKVLSSVKPSRMFGSIVALVAIMGSMAMVLKSMSGKKFKGVGKAAAAMILMATAVNILSAAVKKLANLKPEQLALGVGAIGAMLAELVLAVKFMKPKGLILTGVGLNLIASALSILAKPVKELGQMSLTELAKGLGAIGAMLTELTIAMKFMSKPSVLLAGAGLILIAKAIGMLVPPMQSFGKMKWSEIAKGLVAMGAGLAEMTVAMQFLKNPMMITGAAALVILAQAMQTMIVPMEALGQMKWSEIAKGLVGIGVVLTEMTVALIFLANPMVLAGAAAVSIVSQAMVVLSSAMEQVSGLNWGEIAKALVGICVPLAAIATVLILTSNPLVLAGAAAILVVSASLSILSGVMALLGNMSWGEIIKSLIAMVSALAAVGVASAVLGIASPLILAFGLSLMTVGTGALLCGQGLLSLAAGITAIAGASAVQLTMFIANINMVVTWAISLIPMIATQIANGIVQMVTVIGNSASAFADAAIQIGNAIIAVLFELLPKLVEFGVTAIVTILTAVRDNIAQITQLGIEIIAGLIEGIAEGLPSLIQAGWDLIINFINGLADGLTNNVGRLKEAMKNLGQAMLDAFKEFFGIHSPSRVMKNQGGFITEGLKNGIAGGIANVVNKVKEFAKKIFDKFKAGFDNAGDIGRHLMSGLKHGISGHIGDVLGKVQDCGNKIVSKFKSVLGIHSPSRITREMGMYLDQGLAIGIEKNTDDVDKAVVDLGRATMESMGTALSNLAEMDARPSIRPVLDLSDFQDNTDAINSLFNDEYETAARLTANFNGNQNGFTNSLLNDIAKREDKTEDVVDAVNRLKGEFSTLKDAVNGMQVVIDSGALVGQIAEPMDAALGRRAVLAGRGV